MTPPIRERAFNAPWPVLVLVAAILGLYFLQTRFGADWPERFGLIPADLWQGRVLGLVTYMGVHGSWMHAGSNAIGVLAFGAPLARRLGETPAGMAVLLAFLLICGVISGGGYALMQGDSPVILIGASGAAFGLIGAAARLMNPHVGLEPLRSRRVLGMATALIGANLVIGVFGFDPATGVRGIAWEAHILGLIAGLLLIGPLLGLLPPREPPAPEPRSWGGPWGDRGFPGR